MDASARDRRDRAVVAVLAGTALVAGVVAAIARSATHPTRHAAPVASASPTPEATPGGRPSSPAPSAPSPPMRAPASPSGPAPTVTSSVPPCVSWELEVTLETNRRSYRSGERILFTTTIANVGDRVCRVDAGGLVIPVYDEAGEPVPIEPFLPGLRLRSPYPYVGGPTDLTLRPGRSVSIGCDWNGRSYEGPDRDGHPAYRGTYHAVAEWQWPRMDSMPAYFHLDGPPAPSPSPSPSPRPTQQPSPSPSPSPSLLPTLAPH